MALTVLLMPGLDGTGQLFEPLLKTLPPGLSPLVVRYDPLRVRSYTELFAGIKTPDEPFVLIAESFSGPLAIRIAATRPAHLKALLLVATFARNPWRAFPKSAALRILPAFVRIRPPDIALRYALLGDDASDELIGDVRRALRSVRPQVLAARFREMLSVDVRDELRRVCVPVLFIFGRCDKLIPAAVADEMRACQPNLEIRIVDAPHCVLQCRSREAVSCIAEFLARQVDESKSDMSN